VAILRLTETLGAANSTTTPYDVAITAPSSTPNGVCVVVVQVGSAADQVISVTYGISTGAVPLTERRFVPISVEAGAVYLYWAAGVTFPSGGQTIRLDKTAATANHRMAICPMTVAANMQVSVDLDTSISQQTATANPTWPHTTVAAPTECYFGIISGLQATTGVTVAANWTVIGALEDAGAQLRGFGRRTMNPAGNAVPGLVASTAEDYAGASISFKEAPLNAPPSEPPGLLHRSPRPAEQNQFAGPGAPPPVPSTILPGG
jgi:hypothetical protein